jgi:hypothetical protein
MLVRRVWLLNCDNEPWNARSNVKEVSMAGMTGAFFRNVGGSVIGDIPELGLGDVTIAPGDLLYVPDDDVASRMAQQTTLYQQVEPTAVLKAAKSGRTIHNWQGSPNDMERLVSGGKGKTTTS